MQQYSYKSANASASAFYDSSAHGIYGSSRSELPVLLWFMQTVHDTKIRIQ
uniref:Uncharacterized protein n=1 Tax=Arundo donax TaxID=35708 RepID=A0A0A9BG21_ARUDO